MNCDNFDAVVALLKSQLKYHPKQNISDYWFENRSTLSKIVDSKYPWHSQTFDLLIRWHSELGDECNWQIIKFIEKKIFKRIDEKGIEYLNTPSPIIDFDEFNFTYKGETYTLKKVVDSFNTSKCGGLHDLRGINLSYIDLVNCEVNNCFFANANFSHSNIQQVKFSNCIFTYANFDYARLVMARYDDNTSFGSISVKNAFINNVDFRGFSDLKNIKNPSYFFLIKSLFKSYICMNDSLNPKHTTFNLVQTEKNTYKDNIELVSYIDWFQYVNTKIYRIKELTLVEQIKFILALVTTKYWSSIFVLFNVSLIINIIYSFIYYLLKDDFKENLKGIIDCIYYSISTFTSGFGDPSPISTISKLLVMSEVFIGYTILGAFIFLLSRKISKLF